MKRAVEALFLFVLVIAAIYLVAESLTRGNQQPPGDNIPGGTFEVEVLSITVDPQQPMVGQAIQVVAVLKNVGSASGTYQAQLKIDGVVKYTLDVNLEPDETKNAQFTGSIATPGEHLIEVGGMATTITVMAPPPGGSTERWSATINAPT